MFYSVILLLGLVASGASAVTGPASRVTRPNFLVILLDDVGVDRVGAYAEHPDPGRTPNIDRLASVGVLFRNAYANPICSPTRATILTGRYSFRTGVGRLVQADGSGNALRLDETTIPELLSDYASAALGKWHLGHDPLHPNRSGFDRFSGSLYNLGDYGLPVGQGSSTPGYFWWGKTVDGVTTPTELYATTDTADDTIAAMQSLPEPWFIYSAFNAPHTPVHEPPATLHSYDLPRLTAPAVPDYVRAMNEALDVEIGRVLQNMPPNTFVFVIGDNGTAKDATDAPFIDDHAKGTPFEGGINVPFIVYGPGIARGESRALINTSDIYATLAELSGHQSDAEDSVSFAPHLFDLSAPSTRRWAFAEKIGENKQNLAMRGERYKLIRRVTLSTGDVNDRLFDLVNDPFEQVDLLQAPLATESQAAYEYLRRSIPE